MKKQITCLLVCFVLLFSYVLPIFAESEKLDLELTKIALMVKNTLDIPDDFSHFSSSVDDYSISKLWTLNWSNSDASVNVTADSKGKIYSYYASSNNYTYRDNRYFEPVFTKDKLIASRKIATTFLDKVLDENESIVFDDSQDISKYSTNLPNYFYLTGIIQINGLNSPFKFSISVNTNTLSVTSFHRDRFDNSYVNYVPSNNPNVTKEDAKPYLSTTYNFKLEYALENDKSNVAKLYYFPSVKGNYFVDAKTGKLVDKNSLYPNNSNNDANLLADDINITNEASKATFTRGLTEVELKNISKLHDVLDKNQIDSLIKAKLELGISDYNLSTSYYSTNPDSDEVYCDVVYTSSSDFKSLGISKKNLNADNDNNYTIRKYLKLDAKTGELISFSTQYPYISSDIAFNEITYSTKEYYLDFLNNYHKDLFYQTKLYDSTSYSSSKINRKYRVYSQNVSDYFFTPNSLRISFNQNTGFVDSFSKTWDNNIKFEDTNNLLDQKTCEKLFYDACLINLSYITIPTPITENRELYVDYYGYSYLNKLCLAYTLENNQHIYRINAKSGELIDNNYNIPKNVFNYSDIDDCYAKDRILKLCEHGIGFEYNKLNPSKELTQLDALVLFCNALGYSFDITKLSSRDLDTIYSVAHNYNFIKPDEKQPLKYISRQELIKLLISSSRYSNVAELKNIFKCDFNDANDIPDDSLSYVCVAYSLGVIIGDLNLNFNPNNIATRLDACNILYNFMEQ